MEYYKRIHVCDDKGLEYETSLFGVTGGHMKPFTRIEHFWGRAIGNKRAKKLRPVTRKEAELGAIRWEPELCSVSTTTVDIAAEDNTIYDCLPNSMYSISLSSYPDEGIFCIIFKSGEVPTVLRIPASIRMPPDFSVEANTRYEINVMNGYATCILWSTVDDLK